MLHEIIGANLAAVRLQIRNAAEAANRDVATVRLVAVSKTVGTESVLTAIEAGQLDFGENQVQELAAKAACLPGACTWHLIGHLQRNKVRPAVACAAWIHSVDSEELLERIDRVAEEEGRCPSVLLQVNLSGESSKSGALPTAVNSLLRCALQCSHLSCRGLMTMAPYQASESELRKVFGGLRRLRDHLQEKAGAGLPELSMGMSGDFPVAVSEGATLLRIGTAIFGPRS